jgi:hypothetical protein
MKVFWKWLTKQEIYPKAKAKVLRQTLAAVEYLILEIESKKPNLSVEEATRIRQARCKHAKGNRRHGIFHKDYAIRDFTFIDDTREVACLICGKKWRPGYQDWDKALEMLDSTTNTASSSERIFREDFSISASRRVERHSHSEEQINEAYALERSDDESVIRGRKVKS